MKPFRLAAAVGVHLKATELAKQNYRASEAVALDHYHVDKFSGVAYLPEISRSLFLGHLIFPVFFMYWAFCRYVSDLDLFKVEIAAYELDLTGKRLSC